MPVEPEAAHPADEFGPFPARDHVELIDAMGSDARVVNAARVSHTKRVPEGAPLREGDRRLIGYLAAHEHVSPFFHPTVTFRIAMPIFVAREWFRHTVGLARNEVSRRYVTEGVRCYVPPVIRARAPEKKQGSRATAVAEADLCAEHLRAAMAVAVRAYRALLDRGVAPELARIVLPQAMMTEFYETGSLAAYARICRQRAAPGAQAEIREYAAAVGAILAERFPESWARLTGAPPAPRADAEPRPARAGGLAAPSAPPPDGRLRPQALGGEIPPEGAAGRDATPIPSGAPAPELPPGGASPA